MTNDQIPMTDEKDNDQFTNNQLTKRNGRADCLHHFGYWSLSVYLIIGIWSIGYYPPPWRNERRDQPRPG